MRGTDHMEALSYAATHYWAATKPFLEGSRLIIEIRKYLNTTR